VQVESNVSRGTRPSRDQVLADVKQIIGEQMAIPPEKIRESHTLVEDLGCDSLDIVEITMETEEQFGISVPDELVERIRTVGDVADGVLELLGQGRDG
jgi:acyl carrier protein